MPRGGDPPHRLREVAERLDHPPRVVESPPGYRGHEHRPAAPLPDHPHELPKCGRVAREGAGGVSLRLLIVVAELDQHDVARAQLREDLVEPPATSKRRDREPRLRVVRNDRAGPEERRQHLPPAGIRLSRLVGHRRVAGQKDPGHGGVVRERLDRHAPYAGRIPEKLEREAVVPGGRAEFPLLERHAPARKRRPADIDEERAVHAAPLRHPLTEHEQPAGLTLARGHALDVIAAELDRDAVDALGHVAGEPLRLGGPGSASDQQQAPRKRPQQHDHPRRAEPTAISWCLGRAYCMRRPRSWRRAEEPSRP